MINIVACLVNERQERVCATIRRNKMCTLLRYGERRMKCVYARVRKYVICFYEVVG